MPRFPCHTGPAGIGPEVRLDLPGSRFPPLRERRWAGSGFLPLRERRGLPLPSCRLCPARPAAPPEGEPGAGRSRRGAGPGRRGRWTGGGWRPGVCARRGTASPGPRGGFGIRRCGGRGQAGAYPAAPPEGEPEGAGVKFPALAGVAIGPKHIIATLLNCFHRFLEDGEPLNKSPRPGGRGSGVRGSFSIASYHPHPGLPPSRGKDLFGASSGAGYGGEGVGVPLTLPLSRQGRGEFGISRCRVYSLSWRCWPAAGAGASTRVLDISAAGAAGSTGSARTRPRNR